MKPSNEWSKLNDRVTSCGLSLSQAFAAFQASEVDFVNAVMAFDKINRQELAKATEVIRESYQKRSRSDLCVPFEDLSRVHEVLSREPEVWTKAMARMILSDDEIPEDLEDLRSYKKRRFDWVRRWVDRALSRWEAV